MYNVTFAMYNVPVTMYNVLHTMCRALSNIHFASHMYHISHESPNQVGPGITSRLIVSLGGSPNCIATCTSDLKDTFDYDIHKGWSRWGVGLKGGEQWLRSSIARMLTICQRGWGQVWTCIDRDQETCFHLFRIAGEATRSELENSIQQPLQYVILN